MLTELPIVVVLAFLVAGLVKGVTGLGLPTVAIGLLGSVLAPGEAGAFLVVPTLVVTKLRQLVVGPSVRSLVRRRPRCTPWCSFFSRGRSASTHRDLDGATVARPYPARSFRFYFFPARASFVARDLILRGFVNIL